jgi:hypothetical protein
MTLLIESQLDAAPVSSEADGTTLFSTSPMFLMKQHVSESQNKFLEL